MNEELKKQVTMKVRAVIREAREAYNASYGFALKVLEIPEIKIGLELFSLREYGENLDELPDIGDRQR